ncbi:MAG: tetratricopeptide repeat protein [Alphaproteobacteria bacterium]
MGLAKFIIAGATVAFLTGAVAESFASSQKGISAFQRGKYEDALKYLEPAAEKGDAEALYYLGRMYSAGQGVAKDQQKATDFFKKAAEGGSAGAQQSLGSALMLGEGIETDMIEALKWFIISARAGNKDASNYAGRVARFMTRAQRLEARKKALAWQQAHKKTEPASN